CTSTTPFSAPTRRRIPRRGTRPPTRRPPWMTRSAGAVGARTGRAVKAVEGAATLVAMTGAVATGGAAVAGGAGGAAPRAARRGGGGGGGGVGRGRGGGRGVGGGGGGGGGWR